MNRARFTGFAALVVMFFFAQLHHWSASQQYAAHGTGAMTAQELIQSQDAGSWTRRIGVLSIGLFGAFVLACSRERKLRIQGATGIAILLFFSLALASVMWSDDGALTERRAMSFAILWFAALGVVCYYKQKEVLYLLFLTCMAFVCLGVATELALGTFAPTDPLYRFCGTIHPNHQAWNCAGLALSGIALGDDRTRHRLFFLGTSALGIGALILTKSRTSIAAFALAIIIYKALVSTRKYKELCLQMVLILCAGLALCAVLPALEQADLAPLTEETALLGRRVDEVATLSGRIPLWKSGLGYFYDRPVLGYGFNAFETPQRIMQLQRRAGWAAATFHSEYFDLLLGVGCTGAIIYLFVVLSGLRKTLLLYKRHHSTYYAIESALIVFFLVAMFMENPGRDPNIPTFVFFTVIARRSLLRETDSQAPPCKTAAKSDFDSATHQVRVTSPEHPPAPALAG